MQVIIEKKNGTRVQTDIIDANVNDLPPQFLSWQQPQMKASGMDTSRLDIFIATRMSKDGILLDGDTKAIFEIIKERLSQVPDGNQTRALKELVFTELVSQDGHGHMHCLGKGTTPTELHCISSATPIALDSIPEEVLQLLIQKVEEKLQTKVRVEARAEITLVLENFFMTIVTDTSSMHRVEMSSSINGNLKINRRIAYMFSLKLEILG
ncbi:hypothetical protein ACH5RR_003060 [Cinchona calisaya]|uniref:Uncharacterized protein n=1 Tax=Cinchona calisaya TaxID=153742 RepID=A0ABD3ATQ7_9GENT